MLGLQGSGKTTTTGKLARLLAKQGRHPVVVSTDVRRPAAIEQLSIVGAKAGVRVFAPAGVADPVARARGAMVEARNTGCDVVIVDTAGRLHIDDDLMAELVAIKGAVEPSDLLYVADAMTGQDAIKSAGEFHRQIGVTGVVLSKVDGDARGGAALSVVSVVGVPIAFVGRGRATRGYRTVSRRPIRVAPAGDGRRPVAHREGRGSHRQRRCGAPRGQDSQERRSPWPIFAISSERFARWAPSSTS